MHLHLQGREVRPENWDFSLHQPLSDNGCPILCLGVDERKSEANVSAFAAKGQLFPRSVSSPYVRFRYCGECPQCGLRPQHLNTVLKVGSGPFVQKLRLELATLQATRGNFSWRKGKLIGQKAKYLCI